MNYRISIAHQGFGECTYVYVYDFVRWLKERSILSTIAKVELNGFGDCAGEILHFLFDILFE